MTDDSEYDAEARFALAAAPLAQKVADAVRAMLPPGTHFGVFILTPPHEGEGRVIAVTTDRNVVGPQVAQRLEVGTQIHLNRRRRMKANDAGTVEHARHLLFTALQDPEACKEALRLNLNGEYDRLIDIIAEMADEEPLPPGVAAEAVAETMRWLPEEHARARVEAGLRRE